jgi:Uma2 family endonuclease
MSSGLFRYTPRSFQHAVDAGVFGEQKVEMVGGVPYIMTQNPPHSFVVIQVASLLRAILPARSWTIAEEKTIRLDDSLPMPDVAVIRHAQRAFLGRHPEPEDIRLLVEAADTTWTRDRGPKWRRYAGAGIPEYWIIRIDRRTVHVYTDPDMSTREYRRSVRYHSDDAVPFEGAQLAVADMLPPA